MYDKLATKVNNIDTSGFLLKTKYDTDKLELEKEIPDVSNLVKKIDYNTKVSDIEGKNTEYYWLSNNFCTDCCSK